jgi:hypothetical protein
VTANPKRERLRSIESAAIAGVVYAVLTIVALFIFRRFPDPSLANSDIAAWYNDTAHHTGLIVALNLVSIASVAFLWFVAVIRRRMGDREDRFFSTVFLGSALLYLATFIAGAVAMAAPAVGSAAMDNGVVDRAAATLTVGTTSAMLLIIGPRLQAVFMLTTSTLILRTRVMPNWLAYFGYATGILLFLFPIVAQPVGIVFPLWVLVVSVTIAVTHPKSEG